MPDRPFLLPLLATATLLLAMPDARAAEGRGDFPPEDVESRPKDILQNRLYHLDGRVEVGAQVLMSMNDQFTQHLGLQVNAYYHIIEMLSVEVAGQFFFPRLTGESDLARRIRQRGDANPQDGRADNRASEVTDRNELFWAVVGDAQWEPIYGKLSLFSDLDVHFKMYILTGGGVAGVQRTRLCDGHIEEQQGAQTVRRAVNPACTNLATGVPTGDATTLVPLLHFGGGWRFFINDMFSVKLELRSHVAWSKLKVQEQFAGVSDNPDPAVIREVTDVTFYPMLHAGVGVVF
jgi:outer membrane beta-barrel protein